MNFKAAGTLCSFRHFQNYILTHPSNHLLFAIKYA